MNQLTIEDAIHAGKVGMSVSFANAQDCNPQFAEIAERAILAHLHAVRQASGEELTELARNHGAVCRDGRAFGSVFKSLSKRGLIRCIRSDLPRKRGHGTSGGKLWGIGQ